MKQPRFWVLFGLVAIACGVAARYFFPLAFSILALDVSMDRDRALAEAAAIMAREQLGPAGFQQAASFGLDTDTQTFVELEGGGKPAFTAMLGDGLYAPYAWRVRHFKEGETNETTIRFAPRPQSCARGARASSPAQAIGLRVFMSRAIISSQTIIRISRRESFSRSYKTERRQFASRSEAWSIAMPRESISISAKR